MEQETQIKTGTVAIPPCNSARVRVSIGMPVFNGQAYLRAAIEALLRQSVHEFELIISDNASTDLTGEICREYANRDRRVRYFRQEKNIGAAANFDFVLQHASGEVFMWAAYDDLWSDDYLQTALPLFDDPAVGFVFPVFSVASIRMKIRKKFDPDIFRFIESADAKVRVQRYVALHHDSHKCNLVYSLFRKHTLLKALGYQNIGNDGVLATVILSLSKGRLLEGWRFTKRYPLLWPGFLTPVYRLFGSGQERAFIAAKASSLQRLIELFPNDESLFRSIFDRYEAYRYGKQYAICPSDDIKDGANR